MGPGSVIVHSQFGGQIFGFDIDRNGTEGVLSESHTLSNGNVEAAVETFDQKTGKILKVVSKTETQDDFLIIGIANGSVGLVEREHVQGIFVSQRIYQELKSPQHQPLHKHMDAAVDQRRHYYGDQPRSGFSDHGCARFS